jgi:dTDP-4-dehydrorhamnose reductase
MKTIILGASGMLGHMLCYYFKKKRTAIISCSRSTTNIDWLDGSLTRVPEYSKKYISDMIQHHRPCKVINCVGITNINENIKEGYFINSELPLFISKILDQKDDGSQLIQISTNGVFSGKRGNYIESDIPDATDAYAQSKLKGEIVHSPHLTIRTSIIGTEKQSKKGLLEWFLNQKKDVNGYTEEKWNGVTTLECAKFIHWAIDKKLSGLVHFFSKKISKNDLLNIIKEVYEKKIEINPDSKIKSDRTLSTNRPDINYTVQSHHKMLVELKNISF